MAKWVLIDGFNLMFRAFHGLPELTRSDGFPTGALHGWVKTLWRLQDLTKPEGMLVFFDLGGAQDRLALHPEYKAQRTEMPLALQQQIVPIKALTRAMGLVGIEKEGVESDDLLASEAMALARAGHEILIVSADKDFAQVVGPQVKLLLPPPTANPKLGWRTLDAAAVREKFGVPPERMADYLALVGDTSDNIRGVDGVGPKTASKWLNEFGSLDGVIARADELKPDRFQAVVAESAERLRLNRQLTTLNLALPSQTVEKATVQLDELCRLLEEFEMKSTRADAEKRYRQAELF